MKMFKIFRLLRNLAPRNDEGWLNQAGVIHLIPLFLLLAGIIAGVYLVQHPQIFKPKAYNSPLNQRFLYQERINSLKTEFNISENTNNERVQQIVKDDLFKSDIVITGDIASGNAQVSVVGDCINGQVSSYDFSEAGLFPQLCLSNEQKEKAVEFVQMGAEAGADFIIPYSQAKKAIELGSEMEEVKTLLRNSGLADRIQTNSISSPDSTFGGYIVTLIRIKELEEDVKQNPDGNGNLTAEQEESRREYVAVLRDLWEKQHNLSIEIAGVAALSVIDRPLKIVGSIARPITEPLSAKVGQAVQPISDFVRNSWEKLIGRTVQKKAVGMLSWEDLKKAENEVFDNFKNFDNIEEGQIRQRLSERGFSDAETALVSYRIRSRISSFQNRFNYWRPYQEDMEDLIGRSLVRKMGTDTSREAFEGLLQRLAAYQDGALLQRIPSLDNPYFRDAILETVNNDWVFIMNADEYLRRYGDSVAHAQGYFVVIRESSLEQAGLLPHEFTHIISHKLKPGFANKISYYYDQNQIDTYGALMSQIYELSTDLVVEELYGIRNTPYKTHYPLLSKSMDSLINTLITQGNGAISRADFMEFALTGSDEVLRSRIFEFLPPEEFMALINREIDTAKLVEIVEEAKRRRLEQAFKIGTGGVLFTEGTVFFSNVWSDGVSGKDTRGDAIVTEDVLELDQDSDLTP